MTKNMKIKTHERFKKTFLDIFKHKNIQYFGTNIQDQSIPGEVAARQVELSLVTFEQVR